MKTITSANSSKHDAARAWLIEQLAWERNLASLRQDAELDEPAA